MDNSSTAVAEPPDGPKRAEVDVVGRHKGLVRRTALISFLTLLSRIVGFARETLAASIFGDKSAINDAFVTAWRVPNLFRSLLGEGAISTSLQTALTKADAEHGEAAGRRLFVAILKVVSWLSCGVCAVVMLAVYFMPDTMPLTGIPWLGTDPGPVRELTLRMMPFVILVCVSAVCSGALYVRGHYLSSNVAPVLMNIWWIIALFIVIGMFGWARPQGTTDAAEAARQMSMARWLAGFVMIAGAILVLVQLPALLRMGLVSLAPQTSRRPSAADQRQVWGVLKTAAPLALGAAVYQVNVMIDGLMAESFLANGGPSLLYYATRIQQFPMSLVSIAATSAVYPALTALGHKRSMHDLRDLHDRTQLAIAFVAVPASMGLFALADPVIAVCFQHGAFGPEGVARAAAGLRFLCVAILPAGATGLVARTYYALGDVRTPVKISICMLIANVILNATFILALGMDIDGLALATALAAWGNLVLLLPGLRSRLDLPSSDKKPWRRFGVIVIAALASAALARVCHAWLDGRVAREWAVGGAILAAVIAYGGAAQFLRIPEWRQLMERARRLVPSKD